MQVFKDKLFLLVNRRRKAIYTKPTAIESSCFGMTIRNIGTADAYIDNIGVVKVDETVVIPNNQGSVDLTKYEISFEENTTPDQWKLQITTTHKQLEVFETLEQASRYIINAQQTSNRI